MNIDKTDLELISGILGAIPKLQRLHLDRVHLDSEESLQSLLPGLRKRKAFKDLILCL